MSIKARVFDQFRMPRGAFGVLVGRLMSTRSTNRQRSVWTVDLLDLQPDDRVLELGYGPGLGIEAALRHLSTGRVVGIDHSATMQKMASKQLRSLDTHVEVELRLGNVEAPLGDIGEFDKIFSCNVWLFWKDPVQVLKNLREHLAPGGTIAVTHLPRQPGATRETTMKAGALIGAQLSEAGYSHVRQELLDLEPVPVVCVLASNN
jgi:cyclopropane fatty-acyl-phospholipid synthase-like methyltransferase